MPRAAAPWAATVSTFLTRAAASSGRRLTKVAAQPAMTVHKPVTPAKTPKPKKPKKPKTPKKPKPPKTTTTTTPKSSGPHIVVLGDYSGGDDPGSVQSFAAATGAHPLLAGDYLVGSQGWDTMVNAGNLGAWQGSGYRLVLGVPIIPDGTGGTLAGGAAGDYNSQFVDLAHNLVNAGDGNAILRLGWEFNTPTYNWAVSNVTTAKQFAAFWRNIVTAMRSVKGQSFAFVWNPNGQGPTNYTPLDAYPGDAYVNYVGTDIYDNCWCSPQTPANAWSAQLSQAWGLNWLASFAAAHGKPIAFPEWSVDYRSDGHGLGDDPYFINHFASWIEAHNVTFTVMFSFNDSDQENDITDGRFPQALAAFRADFG